MPFDALPSADLFDGVPERPCARFLIRVLREGPEGRHWPKGFVWDFCTTGTCALGLAMGYWPDQRQCVGLGREGNFTRYYDMAEALTGCRGDTRQVFGADLSDRLGIDIERITQAHVADALEHALATQAGAR